MGFTIKNLKDEVNVLYININKGMAEASGGLTIYRNCSEQRKEFLSTLNEEDRTTTG